MYVEIESEFLLFLHVCPERHVNADSAFHMSFGTHMYVETESDFHISSACALHREVEGWGRVPFSRNLMSPTPRRKWYLTMGRRAH